MINKNKILKLSLYFFSISLVFISGIYIYNNYSKTNNPLIITSNFYQDWLDYQGNPLSDGFYKNHPALSQKMENKIDTIIGGFDKGGYDPVLLAQDKPNDIKMKITHISDKVAVLTLVEFFGSNQKELKVDLVKLDRTWQIDDIRDTEKTEVPVDTLDYQNLVGDYIRENISALSTEEAVLGGKFYVTEIRFENNNKAIVEYEDGHIAFQAEVQYEILPDNTVRVDSFAIIENY